MGKRSKRAPYRSIDELAFIHVMSGKQWTTELAQLERICGRGGSRKALQRARETARMVGALPQAPDNSLWETYRSITKRYEHPAYPQMQRLPPVRIKGREASFVIIDDVI